MTPSTLQQLLNWLLFLLQMFADYFVRQIQSKKHKTNHTEHKHLTETYDDPYAEIVWHRQTPKIEHDLVHLGKIAPALYIPDVTLFTWLVPIPLHVARDERVELIFVLYYQTLKVFASTCRFFCNYHFVWLLMLNKTNAVGKNKTDRQSSYEYTQFSSWELLSSCTAIIFYCDATREDSYEKGLFWPRIISWILVLTEWKRTFRFKTHNEASLRLHANTVKESCWRQQISKIKTTGAQVSVGNSLTEHNPLYDSFQIFQFKLKSFVFCSRIVTE